MSADEFVFKPAPEKRVRNHVPADRKKTLVTPTTPDRQPVIFVSFGMFTGFPAQPDAKAGDDAGGFHAFQRFI
jgi:hypothetical protein